VIFGVTVTLILINKENTGALETLKKSPRKMMITGDHCQQYVVLFDEIAIMC